MIEKKIDIKWALVSILGLVILWVGYMATPVHSAITGIVTGKTIDNIDASVKTRFFHDAIPEPNRRIM